MARASGIRTKHQTKCATNRKTKGGKPGRCTCRPKYLPEPWDAASKRKVRGSVCNTLEQAIAERDRIRAALRASANERRLGAGAMDWIDLCHEVADGIEAGTIRTSKGQPYKPSAARAVVQVIRHRLVRKEYHLAGRTLRQIEDTTIWRLIHTLQAEGLSASTVRKHVDAVGVVYRRAQQIHGWRGGCPTTLVDRPSVPRRRASVTADEARTLVGAVPKADGLYLIWFAALATGMRRGELFALRWEDINLEDRFIQVSRGWDPEAKVFVAPKTDRGNRKVGITPALREAFVHEQARTGKTSGLVWSGRDGRPRSSAWANGKARRAWKALGLTPAGLHQMRHAFATSMVRHTNLAHLQMTLGHADLTTTARYVDYTDELDHDAFARFDAQIGDPDELAATAA